MNDHTADTEREQLVRRASEAIAQAAKRVKDDPDRPRFHVISSGQWMNDPNGPIYHSGWHHLFYQINPYGDDSDNKHWGHVRSRDLVYWEHQPIAMWPSESVGETEIWSGGVVKNPLGQVMAFYTSFGPGMPSRDGSQQWVAVADDDSLVNWRKHPENPIVTRDIHTGEEIYQWRDPCVVEVDGNWVMVVSGHLVGPEGDTGVVALYEAKNDELTNWSYRGLLYKSEDAKNIECPNLVCFAAKTLLYYAPCSRPRYHIGEFDRESTSYASENSGLLDQSEDFYAPTGMWDGQGRYVMWGWVKGFRDGMGWNGCLSLPRLMTIGDGGDLLQEPVPELAALRGPGVSVGAMTLDDSPHVVDQDLSTGAEIRAVVDLESAQTVVMTVGAPGEGENAVHIECRRDQLTLNGVVAVIDPDQESLELRLFLDQSVLELFAGGDVCIAKVIKRPTESDRLSLSATGGSAHLLSLDAWEMGSIWISKQP